MHIDIDHGIFNGYNLVHNNYTLFNAQLFSINLRIIAEKVREDDEEDETKSKRNS